MLIKKRTGYEIPSSEITPEQVYLNRRSFMKGATLAAAGALLAACGPDMSGAPKGSAPADGVAPTPGATGAATDELGDPLNT
ncbi:MAG: twin-arginine translocation signal domain-containing protein, partial [Candidatus Promineifilaceae bacterium]